MALPVRRAVTAKQETSLTTVLTVTAPAGVATGDLEMLIVASDKQDPVTLDANGGTAWNALGSINTTVTTGNATSERIYAWWRIRGAGDSSSNDPKVNVTTDHACAARVCWQTGTFDPATPFENIVVGNEDTSDTSFNFPTGQTITGPDRMVYVITGTSRDSAVASTGMPAANSSGGITSLTTVLDINTTLQGGGGFGMTEGRALSPTSMGDWSSTYAAASRKTYISFAIRPVSSAFTKTIADGLALTDRWSAPPGNFPSTGILDDFNRAENPLSQGGNWANVSGPQANGTVCTTGINGYADRADLGSLTDAEAYCTVGSIWPGVGVRLSASPQNGYAFDATTTGWMIRRYDAGVVTTLYRDDSAVVSPGDKIGIRVVGTAITAFVKYGTNPWQQVKTVHDATYSSGRIGILSPAGSLDDFGGGVPGQVLTKTIADGLTLSDSIRKAPAKQVADGLSMTDAISKGPGKRVADGLALTDATAKAAGKGVQDGLQLTDQLGKASSKTVQDGLQLTDQISKGAGKRVDDGLVLTDSVGKGLGKRIADALTLTDSLSKSIGKRIGDGLQIADSILKGIGKRIADALGISDDVDRVLTDMDEPVPDWQEPLRIKTRRGTTVRAQAPEAQVEFRRGTSVRLG